ncbi:hypothetical protein CYD95_01410 [Pediococcus acidilactici]|nr:hypothetical protein CYD95_01410 [Pediococcus acidilactici]
MVPLNPKLTIMPNSSIMVNFQLMLANYPTFVPRSFLFHQHCGKVYSCNSIGKSSGSKKKVILR